MMKLAIFIYCLTYILERQAHDDFTKKLIAIRRQRQNYEVIRLYKAVR